MPSRKRKVADFPQEYLGIWELAVAGRLRLTFHSRAQATHQRQQLYTFRKRLSEESPVVAEPFFQADLKVEEAAGGMGVLTAHVPEWKRQVREQLVAADYKPPDPVALLDQAQAAADAETAPEMDRVLDTLGFKAGPVK